MYLVKTLETYVNEKRNTAEKASIFFESTLRGYSAPEKVATLNDAVLISLNELPDWIPASGRTLKNQKKKLLLSLTERDVLFIITKPRNGT